MIAQNKAAFKALRENLGYSQEAFADIFGVHKRSVTRWERPKMFNEPPQEAFDLLYAAKKQQEQIVFDALDAIKQAASAADGVKPKEVLLHYYQSQAAYEACTNDETPGYFGVANANAYAVATALEKLDIPVRFEFVEVD